MMVDVGGGMFFVLFLRMWSKNDEFWESAREPTYLDACWMHKRLKTSYNITEIMTQ